MLGISSAVITSPPGSAQHVAYRPAVSFVNSGSVPASAAGTLTIKDATSGRIDFSAPLSSPTPAAPGASSVASCPTSWTPAPGRSYVVSASLFLSAGGESAALSVPAVLVTTAQSSQSTSSTSQSGLSQIKLSLPPNAAKIIIGCELADGSQLVPFALPFGREMWYIPPNPPAQ